MVETFVVRFEEVLGDLNARPYNELIVADSFGRNRSPWASQLQRTMVSLEDFIQLTFEAWLEGHDDLFEEENAVVSLLDLLGDGELREALLALDFIVEELKKDGGEFKERLEDDPLAALAGIEERVEALLDQLAKAVKDPVPLLAEKILTEALQLPRLEKSNSSYRMRLARETCDYIWLEGSSCANVEAFIQATEDALDRATRVSTHYQELRAKLVDEQHNLEIYELWRKHTS